MGRLVQSLGNNLYFTQRSSRPPTYFQQIFQVKVHEIEYFKTVAPRKEEEPSLHDDWVSAVDGSSDGYILTGCYDGFGRICGSSWNLYTRIRRTFWPSYLCL
ncbi:hypothetical protein OROGR_018315 [Orobanche gracilis]